MFVTFPIKPPLALTQISDIDASGVVPKRVINFVRTRNLSLNLGSSDVKLM
jgi:hypothetical protein